jgi:alpha-L-rhamnosidase
MLTAAAQDSIQSLESGFRNPPEAARPRVWWHWMDGNISEEGIRLDLEWMKRIGIGGAQLFEAGLPTPKVVEHPLEYLSPGWQQAFRFTNAKAQELGLELTITTSPGWSETGGPWVAPADGMKKMVWSETRIQGGRHFNGMLTVPPMVAGPFQDVPVSAVERGAPDDPGTNLYRDSLVIAYPAQAAHLVPTRANDSLRVIDAATLLDGHFATAHTLSLVHGEAWVRYEFERPVAVRSVRVGLPAPRGFGTPPPTFARLEASNDGNAFDTVAELPASSSPVRSASFPVRTARFFRLLLASAQGGGMEASHFAPGVAIPRFLSAPPASSVSLSEFELFADARVNAAEEKAGFATVPDYFAVTGPETSGSFKASEVVELTRYMRADGRLTWSPPDKRDWTVLRIGYSLTGHRNGPAPASATGLEVDKLDARRVQHYLDTYLAQYQSTLGSELGAGAIRSLLSDSIESGPQNWTEDILEQFVRLRGYDPKPWLPALTGVIVGSSAETERFLWDFRRTLSQRIADAHYGVIAQEAARRGLQYYAEALEDHRPQLGDDLEMRRYADIPMGAMWMFGKGEAARATYVADLQGAASVANVYGKSFVAAESMTFFGSPWGYSPRDLKATADLEMALGVNRFAIHESAHQPLPDSRPGLALSVMLGQYFNRNDTWAEQAKAWVSYLSRSSFILQQGRHVADIAYFYGEEGPLTALYGEQPVDIPAGYGFDFVGGDAILHRLEAHDGELLTPQGQRYRLLYLGGASRHMTLPVLRKIAQFVQAGVAVVGDAPQDSPSLADDPQEFRRLVQQIWSAQAASQQPHAQSLSLQEGLAARQISPDWSVDSPGAAVSVLHRRAGEVDIYFVSNRRDQPLAADLNLRVAGKSPLFFEADSGAVREADFEQEDGRTHIPLNLDAGGSVFVVMGEPTRLQRRATRVLKQEALAELSGTWSLSFNGLKAPSPLKAAALGSWPQSADVAQRFFSGTGSYSQSFQLSARAARADVIDLGVVNDIAEVVVNGHEVGTLWKYPYRARVSGLLHAGRNTITIKVTNLWVNRLIGDAQAGVQPVTHISDKAYLPDAPLRDSGLSGPVTLLGSASDLK